MTKIESFFNGVRSFSGDIWVADYTNKTKHLPKGKRMGVVIMDNEPEDIKSFHLQNANVLRSLLSILNRIRDSFPMVYEIANVFFALRMSAKAGCCCVNLNIAKRITLPLTPILLTIS